MCAIVQHASQPYNLSHVRACPVSQSVSQSSHNAQPSSEKSDQSSKRAIRDTLNDNKKYHPGGYSCYYGHPLLTGCNHTLKPESIATLQESSPTLRLCSVEALHAW